MKAIIMAAGIGSRLKDVNRERPKSLIQVEGVALISRSVSMLQGQGITDICVITGYKSELIHQELQSRVHYLHNPYFQVTNSIASLWLAKDMLCDDVLLLNGDLYYEENVLKTALAQKGCAVMLSDRTNIENADFRFCVRGDRILKTGNKLSIQDTDCEYVGIARIDKSFISAFKDRLEAMITLGDFRNWWEGVLYACIEEGIDIFHKDVEGAFWSEVDHIDDYNRLKRWASSQAAYRVPMMHLEPKLEMMPCVANPKTATYEG